MMKNLSYADNKFEYDKSIKNLSIKPKLNFKEISEMTDIVAMVYTK